MNRPGRPAGAYTAIAPAQRREHPEPHEEKHPIPGPVFVLVGAMTLVGIGYIAVASLESPGSWGDQRERAELMGTGDARRSAIDGAALYAARCASCHQADGRGLPGVFPPLAGSEWVAGRDRTMVAIVLQGLGGELRVAGQTFDGAMPGFKAQLDDAQAAAVISHVRERWGAVAAVTPALVGEVRAALGDRATPLDGQRELESLK